MTFAQFRRLGAAIAVLAAGPLRAQGGATPPLTVHTIFGTREFESDLVALAWLPDGASYTAIEPDAAGNTDLYRVDAATGRRELLVRGADLVPPGERVPIPIESYRFSPDGAKLLVFTKSARVWRLRTKGTFYIWDFRRRRLLPVSTRPGYQQFAKFSPDGGRVAFVRDNNLYVTDLATGVETALTTDGGPDVINGTSDWVYEEELDLRDAFRWSPDGRRIAFWRLDQSAIRPFYLVNFDSLYPALVPVRYPKAGTPNSEVRIGVVDLASGRTTWADLGPERDIYVAAMDFAGSPDTIWLTRLNRRQNRLDLVLADTRTGAARVVMSDSDATWVDPHEPLWLDGGRRFLFVSERDGYAQVYLYDRSGTLIRRVTPGGWDVLGLYGVDEARRVLYFTGAVDGPLTRPLLRIGLDGAGLARVSAEPGTHEVEFAPGFRFYVDVYSRFGVPPVETLHRADGAPVRVLADNHVLRDRLAALGLRAPEFLAVPGADGTAGSSSRPTSTPPGAIRSSCTCTAGPATSRWWTGGRGNATCGTKCSRSRGCSWRAWTAGAPAGGGRRSRRSPTCTWGATRPRTRSRRRAGSRRSPSSPPTASASGGGATEATWRRAPCSSAPASSRPRWRWPPSPTGASTTRSTRNATCAPPRRIRRATTRARCSRMPIASRGSSSSCTAPATTTCTSRTASA
jgi:dipeptidyl-peptidase-4